MDKGYVHINVYEHIAVAMITPAMIFFNVRDDGQIIGGPTTNKGFIIIRWSTLYQQLFHTLLSLSCLHFSCQGVTG